MTAQTEKKFTVKIEGHFVLITGECPLCEWEHPHSHAKDTLHQWASDRAAEKRDKKRSAQAKAEPKMLPTTTTKPDPPKTVKKINVYRVKTSSLYFSLDRTIQGDKRKEAVSKAIAEHAAMQNIDKETVQLVSAHYIGQYTLPDPSSWSYGGHGAWSDNQWAEYTHI